MEKFKAFLDEYHASKASLLPMKKTVSQPPYFDVEMKNKTFFHKGISYTTPVFRISLKIHGDYLNEIKKLPRFAKISEEISKLKQKARENQVQIQTDENGGVEFYRKVYYSDLLEKISPEEVLKLSELAIQKKYLQNQIRKNNLPTKTKEYLYSEFYKKFNDIQQILKKILIEKNASNTEKPRLRIVK